MDDHPDESARVAQARLNLDTGVIGWDELARYFARGVVIVIEPGLDLVGVGQAMIDDRAAEIQAWRDAGQLRRASDDDARRWTADNTSFWAVVVAPWVLVQAREPGAGEASGGVPSGSDTLH